jgi:hypothetical protein
MSFSAADKKPLSVTLPDDVEKRALGSTRRVDVSPAILCGPPQCHKAESHGAGVVHGLLERSTQTAALQQQLRVIVLRYKRAQDTAWYAGSEIEHEG